MGLLDVVLGSDQNGKPSKINMALIALMAWQLYKSMQAKGGAQPSPVPSPAPTPNPQSLPQSPTREARLPDDAPRTRAPGDDEFGALLDSMTRGNATRPTQGDVAGGGTAGGGGLGGGLGDILGDILGGGRGMPGGGRADPRGGGGSGGGMGGPLGDILGDLLGGGRSMPRAGVQGQGQGGSGNPMGDLLGGLLTGGAAGGGLGALLQQFDQAGKGQAARSWVGTGANEQLSPREIEDTFGSGIIDTLASRFGMPKDELLQGLSEEMPKTIDQLTPQGQLPSREDVERWV